MKKRKWLLWTLAALLLAGCSLARPEEAGQNVYGDRFAGFYMVYMGESYDSFYDNPYLEEYGAVALEAGGYGTLSIPQEVLFAVRDETYHSVFPGMEDGYSLFLLERNEEHGPSSEIISNMAPGQESNSTHVSDTGSSYSLSGTIYCVETEHGEGLWKCYRVYQAEDGRPYLNGEGNTFSGGGSFGCGENQTWTTTNWDGGTVTESIDIHVWVEEVEPLERLVVTQFDENNTIVRSDDLALREELPKVKCEEETAWVLVEEIRTGGTVRTAYNVPEEGELSISHLVVLPDDAGLGIMADLTIR